MSLARVKNLAARFDRLTLRERILVSVGLFALLVLAWDAFLMKPLSTKRIALTQELDSINRSFQALGSSLALDSGPFAKTLQQQRSLEEALASVNAQLQTDAAGLISPQRMGEAVRDVLAEQRSLRLVSFRNLPVRSLLTPQTTDAQSAKEAGPYVHPVELVIQGSYLDVLAYLRALEKLPWRFYWKRLDLNTDEYPLNSVRIEICTLSMDKAWLGV